MSESAGQSSTPEPAHLQKTLGQLLGHAAAFNQFSQSVLLAATLADGELDLDALMDGFEAMTAAQSESAFAHADRGSLDWLGQWLSTLAAGARGDHDAARPGAQAADLMLDWQRVQRGCYAHWSSLAAAARNEFRRRVASAGESGFGLMDLYTVWVDAYERAYARMLRKPAFLRDHAHLLNLGVQLAEQLQAYRQPWFAALGLPSRDELDRLSEELQRLRRQQRGQSPP